MGRQQTSCGRIDTTTDGYDRDFIQRSTTCGPFRAASDFEDGESPQYSCNLALFLPHPEVEQAEYSVDITYPGASGEDRTMSVFAFCTCDGESPASCDL